MSTGNPYGLSEISHYGSMRNVGGKAGGFINKKFFHPSTLRNQEKLWKAQTEDEREFRKQQELQKRRDEERQVEELRKQMYLSGQGKSTDFLSTAAEASAATSHLNHSEKAELKQAIAEQQKRRLKLKRAAQAQAAAAEKAEKAEEGSDEEEGMPSSASPVDRSFAKSRYPEDVMENEHSTVWGSWYSREEERWGFRCCKLLSRGEVCPEGPKEPEKEVVKDGRRKRKEEVQESGASSSSKPEAPPPVIDPESLLDTRMLEAAAKRRRVKSFQELKELNKKSETKESDYLEELLQEPS